VGQTIVVGRLLSCERGKTGHKNDGLFHFDRLAVPLSLIYLRGVNGNPAELLQSDTIKLEIE
jgi:hypothetical protein